MPRMISADVNDRRQGSDLIMGKVANT